MKRLITVLLVVVSVVSMSATAATAAPARHHTYSAGCGSNEQDLGLHEQGHIADLTEVATRCWGPEGNLLKSGTGVTWSFSDTEIGKALGFTWKCDKDIDFSNGGQKDIICHGHDQACLFKVIPICGFDEQWRMSVTIDSPKYDHGQSGGNSYTWYPILDGSHSTLSSKPNGFIEVRETVKPS